ncbi:MAG: hypothetical protein M3Z54_06385 [Gemmatimonadota bacterium]|nr:hypothetical protein [Gemmatimonadota bacterium]
MWSTKGAGSFTAGVVCGRYMMANAFGIDVFDRGTGKKLGEVLASHDGPSAYPTSHFATDGKRAFITGHLWAWALDC